MDAEKLLFADESFDMVISRNLTWTLPHPQEAYREWQRVLKAGGVLLNFDGNYGKADFTGKGEKLPENHAHKQIAGDLIQECEAIKEQLEISYHVRPAWDITALEKAGFEQIRLDLGISKRIYTEKMNSIIRLRCSALRRQRISINVSIKSFVSKEADDFIFYL